MTTDMVGLRDFKIPIRKIAPVQNFRNRREQNRTYRFYPAWSDRLLIFYHGTGGDSRYLCALASSLAEQNLASVLTPDLRGHGPHLQKIAEVDGPDALLEDVADLLRHVQDRYPGKELSLGGHSLGGALAMKALCDPILQRYFKSSVLAAPHWTLPWLEGTAAFQGWLRWDSQRKHLLVQMPEEYRSGQEVLEYDVSFFAAASLKSLEDLRHWPAALPAVLFTAGGDRLFPPTSYQGLPLPSGFCQVEISDVSHMGLVMAPTALESIAAVLKNEFKW